MTTQEKIETLKKSKYAKIRQIVTDGFVRPCYNQGSGRNTSIADYREVVEGILQTFDIPYGFGNDAPKGGKCGSFIFIDSPAILKAIGKEDAVKEFRKKPHTKWRKPVFLKHDEIVEYAKKAIFRVGPKDADDPDGRYWLACYHGAQVYRLIVKDKRILASIPGGFHDSKPRFKDFRAIRDEEWFATLKEVAEQEFGDGLHFIKADGSGCSFFVRELDDAEYVSVKTYSLGLKLNIEVI